MSTFTPSRADLGPQARARARAGRGSVCTQCGTQYLQQHFVRTPNTVTTATGDESGQEGHFEASAGQSFRKDSFPAHTCPQTLRCFVLWNIHSTRGKHGNSGVLSKLTGTELCLAENPEDMKGPLSLTQSAYQTDMEHYFPCYFSAKMQTSLT